MIWLLEFFIGMALYYLIISPKFRAFLKRSIQSWLGRPVSQSPNSTKWVDVTFRDMPNVKTPVVNRVQKPRKVETHGGKLEVDEDTLAELQENLRRNAGVKI